MSGGHEGTQGQPASGEVSIAASCCKTGGSLFAVGAESPEENEAETGHELEATLREIQEKTYADGSHAIKVIGVEGGAGLMALTKKRLDFAGQPDRLRQSVVDFFARQSAEWELRVQLCTDLDSMPIEDAKTVWPEDRSPYVDDDDLQSVAWLPRNLEGFPD